MLEGGTQMQAHSQNLRNTNRKPGNTNLKSEVTKCQ